MRSFRQFFGGVSVGAALVFSSGGPVEASMRTTASAAAQPRRMGDGPSVAQLEAAPPSSIPLPPSESDSPDGSLPPPPAVGESGQTEPPDAELEVEADLESLEPGPNPLLFPTRPEEVELQEVQPLTLAEAIAIAERNNRPLQVARLDLERSRLVLREERAAYFPSLSTTAQIQTQETFTEISDSESSATVLGGQTVTQQNRETSAGVTSFGANLRLDYDIFTSGLRGATVKAAERQVRVDELQVEQQQEQLGLDVKTAYYDLQNADEQVRIAQQAVANAERSLQDAQALERAGLGTRFDVLRSEVQLANEEQTLVNNEADQKTARRQIAEILGLAQDAEIKAADPVAVAGTWTPSLEESIVLAYKHRAELEEQLVLREVDAQQRRIALSAIRPQLSLFAQYDIAKAFNDTRGTLASFDVSNEAFTSQIQAGVLLEWNFFDGGAARARARQEDVDRAIAETNFADTRNQVRLEVEDAFFDLQSNRENITTSSKALDQARESLRLARLRFQAGVGTQTDVIDAETELTEAEGNLVAAIIGYNQALANLQRAVTNIPEPEGTAALPESSDTGAGEPDQSPPNPETAAPEAPQN